MPAVHTRKVVDVDRGLFLVRYVSAEDRVFSPLIRVSQGDNADIRFVVHPDEDDAVLRLPGACLVVQAEAHGQLAIDIEPLRRSGSVAAKVTIEALNTEAAPRPAAPVRRGAAPRRGGLALMGHVAGRGDVAVRAGEWLAGPDMPARIEGFQLAWDGPPDDLAIRYAARTARPQTGSGEFAPMGAFVGSRGKAMPVVALAIDMAGEAASRYRLTAEMIFLGAPILRASGPRISGAGPTGREPLVGLRVAIDHQESDRPRQSAARPASRSAAPKRVRVFRSDEPGPRVIA